MGSTETKGCTDLVVPTGMPWVNSKVDRVLHVAYGHTEIVRGWLMAHVPLQGQFVCPDERTAVWVTGAKGVEPFVQRKQ
jgi:hypothetical protein